jgi:hypothetical protein
MEKLCGRQWSPVSLNGPPRKGKLGIDVSRLRLTLFRRFPAISGFRVEWRTSKEPEKRIEKMWLREETKEVGPDGKPKLIDKEEVKRNHDRKYIVAIGEYMIGGDGYTVFKNQKLILNGENGQSKSTLIRKFLLGERDILISSGTSEPCLRCSLRQQGFA